MPTELNIIRRIENSINKEELFRVFGNMPSAAILDSSLNNNQLGKFSIVAFDPFLIFSSKGDSIEIIRGDTIDKISGNPLNYLKELLDFYKTDKNDLSLPFTSGCIGFFSYDLCRYIEKLPNISIDDKNIPDILLGFYNSVLIIDHKTEDKYISVSSIGMPDCIDMGNVLNEKIEKILGILNSSLKINEKVFGTYNGAGTGNQLKSNYSKEEYCKMVETAREYIRNGDIFQVNLSQRFEMPFFKNPYYIFEKLSNISPAPFSAYLNFDNINIISSSPERFIKIDDRVIETRPIKGTRPRGIDLIEDKLLKDELQSSEKDRAELTMIVDLERNDLGRVCTIGSVKVEKMMEVEEYANVFHLVSTIKGALKEDISVIECLNATFPGGSITGAPKIRAMEIIEELEPYKRNVYTGSIGYIGFDGNADLNIVIRTILVKDSTAFFNVGGGIVWDSVPENEYQETLDKGKSIMEVLSSI